MIREKSLFERLRNPDTDRHLKNYEDPEKISESVLKYLGKMLNTRQGSSLILPNFGMPNFIDFVGSTREHTYELGQEIANSIELYEPRLKNVRVEAAEKGDDFLALHFKVTAELLTDDGNLSLLFDTTLNSAGKFEVKG